MWPSRYSLERKFARYSLDVRAKLKSGERQITVRTLDISEGGVVLVSPAEILEGSSFAVAFEFPTVPGIFRAEVHARSKAGFRYGFSKLCRRAESCWKCNRNGFRLNCGWTCEATSSYLYFRIGVQE
jgi:PilZ domain